MTRQASCVSPSVPMPTSSAAAGLCWGPAVPMLRSGGCGARWATMALRAQAGASFQAVKAPVENDFCTDAVELNSGNFCNMPAVGRRSRGGSEATSRLGRCSLRGATPTARRLGAASSAVARPRRGSSGSVPAARRGDVGPAAVAGPPRWPGVAPCASVRQVALCQRLIGGVRPGDSGGAAARVWIVSLQCCAGGSQEGRGPDGGCGAAARVRRDALRGGDGAVPTARGRGGHRRRRQETEACKRLCCCQRCKHCKDGGIMVWYCSKECQLAGRPLSSAQARMWRCMICNAAAAASSPDSPPLPPSAGGCGPCGCC